MLTGSVQLVFFYYFLFSLDTHLAVGRVQEQKKQVSARHARVEN